MLQCDAVCCSVLQCVAVCCSVLQCVAVCPFSLGLGATTRVGGSYVTWLHPDVSISTWRKDPSPKQQGGEDAYDMLCFGSHFPQKSSIISGFFANRNLQLKTSYGSSPRCLAPWCSVHDVIDV